MSSKKQTAKKRTARKAAPKPKAKPEAKYTKKDITPETPDEIFASLAPKQQQFVAEYLANGFNATRAAITAGYAKANADTQGSRMLAMPKIAAVIAARTSAMLAKREITAERVLDEIAKLAYRDPRKLFHRDGSLVPVHELDEENASAIAGIEVIEKVSGKGKKQLVVRLKKIRLEERGENLERLGRYLKLFTEKVEHSGKVKIERIRVPAKASPPAKKEVKPDFG